VTIKELINKKNMARSKVKPFRRSPLRNLQDQISGAFNKFKEIDMNKNFGEDVSGQAIGNAFRNLKTDQFKNTYEDISNQYANIDETNFAEDLTVNTQAADFERDMARQSQANTMQNLQGAAGGSGIAGLAQAMANQGAKSARSISANLGQQESQVQMQRMAGKQDVQRRRELQMQGQGQAEMMKAQGAQVQQQMVADRETQMAQGQQQADMANQSMSMQVQQMKMQGASDARNAAMQQAQGEIAFLSGQQQAQWQQEQGDKNWGQRSFGW